MTRVYLVLTLVASLGIVRADDRPADQPDRLEKKPKLAEPAKPDEKKPTDKKPDEKKVEPSKDEPADDEDPNVVRERLAKNLQAAEKKLQTPDAGKTTRELQDKILKDIDKLLKRAQNPPPPPMGNPPPTGDPPPDQGDQKPPKGGGSAPPSPGGGQPQPGGGQSRRERREQQRREQQGGKQPGGQAKQSGGGQPKQQPGGQMPQPQGQGNPTGQGGGTQQTAKSPPSGDKVSDVAKDIWGHLPETMRQEVDHYYREQFMPRYRELVRQYYNRLAEQPKRSKEGSP